jgi:hypothetical protein
MNTEGWPPKPRVDGLAFAQATPLPAAADRSRVPAAARNLARTIRGLRGARTCPVHRLHGLPCEGGQRLVGPGWAGLYGSGVAFADGSSARADEAYLTQSIVDPDARVVKDYVPHVMPAYVGMLDAGQIADIVAYIRSLQGGQP